MDIIVSAWEKASEIVLGDKYFAEMTMYCMTRNVLWLLHVINNIVIFI